MTTPNNQSTKGRILRGTVVSNKMQKTVVVAVRRYTKHPKYGKFILTEKRYKAHDEQNAHQVGDEVEIQETRPISRDKHFIVI